MNDWADRNNEAIHSVCPKCLNDIRYNPPCQCHMKNEYEVSTFERGGQVRPCIIIRRKPSEIPYHIDHELMCVAGCAEMDGPHNKVSYEFLLADKFGEGEQYLQRCGWKRKE